MNDMSVSAQMGRSRSDDPTPLYLQLRHLLQDAIDGKMLADDSIIPAEHNLAAELDVSRITVCKAIAELIDG